MQEEIKEILNRLEIVARKHTIEICDGGKIETLPANVVDELRLNNYSAKILLDYITNLQEENDILKRDIEAMKHNYNLLVRCIENGESMTQKFENGLNYQDYKSRNENAIKYVKQICESENDINPYILHAPTLLNILEGDNK